MDTDETRALEYADRLLAEGVKGDRGQIASLFYEALAAETERCAKVADEAHEAAQIHGTPVWANEIATAIRASGS